MKTAIFGGAFNPVHNEHINMVKSAVAGLGLDRVIVIPTFISPHKSGCLSARAKDRLEMCRLAFNGIAEVSDYEVKRGGISYSYVTCRHFKKLYEDDELYFILGADSLKGFDEWRYPEEILKCVTLAVCARAGSDSLAPLLKSFTAKYKCDIVTFDYVGKNVSSTRVRALAALGGDITGLTPPAVKSYIIKNGLYKLPEIDGYKKYLTAERLDHTLRVAVTAAENCRRARVFEMDALIAAALHDCAKYLGENSPELAEFKCPPDVPKPVMHQYSGAYLAENTFKIKDDGVLNAIRYHTSGRENMSDIEKLIYLSDMLEEGREFSGADKLRRAFKRDINEGMMRALEHQIKYLRSTGKAVYPLTERAYEFLKLTGVRNGQ